MVLFRSVPRHDRVRERVCPNQVLWFAALMGGVFLRLTSQVPHCEERQGAAHSQVPHTPGGWPLSTTERSGDTVVCGSVWRQAHGGWFGFARDVLTIPRGGSVVLSYYVGLIADGWDASAIPSVGSGLRQLLGWDALATPGSVGWVASCTRVQNSAARDALRHHAVGVLVVRGLTGLGCRRSGRLRRCHPFGSVCLLAGWDATAIPWSVGGHMSYTRV